MGLPGSHRLKCSALLKKKKKKLSQQQTHATEITSMQCFSKLRPELRYIYVHVQVIRNCTLLSHVDIYNVDGEQQDVKQRKQKPGKHCVVMFCNKTNTDRVSLYQFPQTLDAGQYIWLLPATVPL